MWFVVPDPPLVRRGLWITLRRVLPLLLTPERSDVEVVPGVPHLLIAAVIDEVASKHAVAVADERVRAVPLVHAEVGVELLRHGRPGSPCPWARETRTPSQRPATASADARRPARHGRGSTPSPSRAVAVAQPPTPAVTRFWGDSFCSLPFRVPSLLISFCFPLVC